LITKPTDYNLVNANFFSMTNYCTGKEVPQWPNTMLAMAICLKYF